MTDRPIIFSGPMVRALIEGRKTQTRRVLKPQPPETHEFGSLLSDCVNFTSKASGSSFPVKMPYAIGDRLWVREAFRQAYPETSFSEGFIYRADKPRALGMGEYSDHQKWKPSIHMPRRLSRLTLTVTDVKVQRLQDISEGDAEAEGIEGFPYQDCDGDPRLDGRPFTAKGFTHDASQFRDPAEMPPSAYYAFRALWNTIHGPDAWDANPWVCALTFTVEQRNIDA